MTSFERFRSRLDDLVYEAEQGAVANAAARRRRIEEFRDLADAFEREAERLEGELIAPRIEYMEALFPHAVRPADQGGERHRLRLSFGATEEFPCTAEVFIHLAHDPDPGHCTVSFDSIILPAPLTERYRQSGVRQVTLGDADVVDVAALLDDSLAEFVRHYMQTRSEHA